MPESAASDRLQLHDQAFYNVWKGQLYVRDQLICDVAFQSPTNCCIPSQLSEKLVIKEVIRVPELRKTLPKGIFENITFTGQEVCCESVYCSFFQVLTSNTKGSHLDKLQKCMEENDLAIIKFLNNQGVLVLLPSTVNQSNKDLKLSASSCLVALFLSSHTKVLGEIERGEWESKFTNQDISLKVTRLLPGLQCAILEFCNPRKENKTKPDVLLEKYLRKYANFQKKRHTLVLNKHRTDTATHLSGDSQKVRNSGEERCSQTAFAQLQSYISSPRNFCVPLLAASAFETEKSSNMSDATRSSSKPGGVSANDSLVAATGPEAKTAKEPKNKGDLREKEKKSPTRNGKKKGSKQGKDKSVQVASPSPYKKGRAASDSQTHSSQMKDLKPVSSSSRTMLKLANAQFSKKKRGAEVLTAEFVQGSTVSKDTAGPSSKKRKKELDVSPPKRIMPIRIKRSVLSPPQVTEPERSPDRPPKRKASEQASNALSESKAKLENLRRLVNKHAEEVGRYPKKNAGKPKREQENPVSELKEVPWLEQKERSCSTDILMENIFERRVNMYESHALNLLADLALNSYGISGIPYAPIGNSTLQSADTVPMEDKTVEEDVVDDHTQELLNSPKCTQPMEEPCSAPHPVHTAEPLQTLEKEQITPHHEREAIPVTRQSPRNNETVERPKVNFALAKGKARSNAANKISLEHSYSQLPLDLASTSPVSIVSKEPEAQTVSEPIALPPAAEVLYEPTASSHYPPEIIFLTGDDQVVCPVIKNEPRDVLKYGNDFVITFNWDAKYDFDLDSKFTSDPLEKTINRALHGPWNPHLKEKVEDVKIILHMWLALFYNRSNRPLSCSSRKVVEHSNPAKYVSINTIMDPFELYEIVDSENVDNGLSQFPASSTRGLVGNSSHFSNTGASFLPTPIPLKSDKKPKTPGKDYLGVATSALQLLNTEQVKRDAHKEISSSDKMHQNTDSEFRVYRGTGLSSSAKLIVSSKFSKKEMHEQSPLGISSEREDFLQADMTSLWDVDQGKRDNSLVRNLMESLSPHAGNDSFLSKMSSPESKNLPTDNLLHLPVKREKEAVELPSHAKILMDLERTPKSTNPQDSEMGEQGALLHENVCGPKENIELENKNEKSELKVKENHPTYVIHLKARDSISLLGSNKELNKDGINEPVDLTLPNAEHEGMHVCKSEMLVFTPRSDIADSCDTLTGNVCTDPLVNGELQVSKTDKEESCNVLVNNNQTTQEEENSKSYENDCKTIIIIDSDEPANPEEPHLSQREESDLVSDRVNKAKPFEGVLDNEYKSSSSSKDDLFDGPESCPGPINNNFDILQQPPVPMQRNDISDHGQSKNIPCITISDESSSQENSPIKVATGDTGLINKHLSENLDPALNSRTQVEQSNGEKCDVAETKNVDHLVSRANENNQIIADKDLICVTQRDQGFENHLSESSICMIQKESREEHKMSSEICGEPPSPKAIEELEMAEPVEKKKRLILSEEEVAHFETKNVEKEQTICEIKISQASLVDNLEPLKENCLIQKQINEKEDHVPKCVQTENTTPIPEGTSSATVIISDQENGDQLCSDSPIKVMESPVKNTPFSGEVIKPAGVFEIKTKIPSPGTHTKTVTELNAISKIHESVTPHREINFENRDNNVLQKASLPSENLSILTDLFADDYDREETDKLVQNAITLLDDDLDKDDDISCHYQSPAGEFAGRSGQNGIIESIEHEDERASQKGKILPTLHFDPVSPADSGKNLPVCNEDMEMSSDIITIVEKEIDSPKSGNKEVAITDDDDDDKYVSDVTDVSTDYISPNRYNGTDECDVIILDGNTSMSNGEPESVTETFSTLEQTSCTLPAQDEFIENMEHDIIQEHSDIFFIASTASISEEQYERWSEASHKDLEFLQHMNDKLPQKLNNDVLEVTRAEDSCPMSPRSSSPIKTTTCHERVSSKRSRMLERLSDSRSLEQEADRHLPRSWRNSDHRCSGNDGNFTTDSARESSRTMQLVYKNRPESLFFSQRAISEDLTQNTLDIEHLRFIHRLKVVLRKACTDNFFSESSSRTIFETRTNSSYVTSLSRKRLSPLLITIHCSNEKKRSRRREKWGETYYSQTYNDEPPMEKSSYPPRSQKPVRAHRRASPFHFSRLKYENKHDKSNSDISLILSECVQTNHLQLSRVSLSNMSTDRTSSLELPDECVQTKKTFTPPSRQVPAFKNIISDLCTGLHTRLHSVVEEYSQKNFRYYILETSDDPFFSQAKSLLKKDGHTATEPQHFCNSKQVESDRLLVIIRNEDISSHIHKIPCLTQLKLYPNVSFVGVDCPEDIIDSTHQELFHSGGFVVSDHSVLETITPGKLKEVAAVLEKLNKTAVWKWLLHYRENRKLKEDKRPDSLSHMKNTLLKSYQQMNIVEVLPYHQCDSKLKAPAEGPTCVLNLQSQHIHSRLAVYLTEKPSSVMDDLEHKGVLVFDVDTFIRKIQNLYAQLQASCWS